MSTNYTLRLTLDENVSNSGLTFTWSPNLIKLNKNDTVVVVATFGTFIGMNSDNLQGLSLAAAFCLEKDLTTVSEGLETRLAMSYSNNHETEFHDGLLINITEKSAPVDDFIFHSAVKEKNEVLIPASQTSVKLTTQITMVLANECPYGQILVIVADYGDPHKDCTTIPVKHKKHK